jgi:O-methyltransferase
MDFRYNSAQRIGKIIYRKFLPVVPMNPYRSGTVKDICKIDFFPPKMMRPFFARCIKTLGKIKGKNIGDYLEFGVFNGGSMSNMYLTCKELGVNIRFFGFDSFEGLPKKSKKEDDGVWKQGFYACSFEKMKECLKRKEINAKDINWVKGWYKDTLNDKTLKKFELKKIGIAMIDCDTYSSSKSVLDFIGPLITEPAILCFDDWKLNNLDVKGMGEYKSFNEFLDINKHLEAKEIRSYNRKSKSFLVKPRIKNKKIY